MKCQVNKPSILLNVYRVLYELNGNLKWWPGDTDFEVCVGAILTQNTSWTNVEKAISNLKQNKLMEIDKVLNSKLEDIAKLIRPAGYFNQKAFYLKEFCKFLQIHSLFSIKSLEMNDARDLLLGVKGIGKETADSIMLYALGFPIFVIDAYPKRIFSRISVISESNSYDETQALFMKNLITDVDLFNDYHAQIVELGKNYCEKKPNCRVCPLRINELCFAYLR